ncbi:MAG TPA: hypothetical protein VG860_17330 [Terriglobia bacterium]|jgi:hypothetical protein|nr:hypothetical protein [Terriglobia bacterium]
MEQERLRWYFERQLRDLLLGRDPDRDNFLDYFHTHAPSDQEILGLLAVTTVSDSWSPVGPEYPTQLEALAALPEPDRAALCHEFRRLLAARPRC